ncbi:MAG: alpha/beta fold hydrolase [Candidatus Thorarchaeota archaeon]
MLTRPRITQSQGNTPIKKIPEDYFPEGCGFWFRLSEGLDANKKIFFRYSWHGNGTAEKVILFVHGNPENSYTYRKVINTLIDNAKKPFRIVTVDHIGFGLSDQATYEMVCMDHANNLLQLVKYLDLKNVTLIIHDWGGPIGIGAFLKVPERISNLVILNSTIFPMPENGITYQNFPGSWVSWARGPKIIPNRLWGAFAAFSIFCKPMNPTKLFLKMVFSITAKELGLFPKKEKIAQKIFKKQFKPTLNVLSSKRLVLQTPVWGYGNIYFEPKLGERDTSPFYRFIQDNINNLWGSNGQNIGARAILGDWDPSAKIEVIKQWLTHLPQLEGHIKIFKGFGHFIEETKPKEIANEIINVAELI